MTVMPVSEIKTIFSNCVEPANRLGSLVAKARQIFEGFHK